jgi:hypothetical protein
MDKVQNKPHSSVLHQFVSIEAIGVCIPIGNSEVLLVYISTDHAWNDTDITELLSYRHKALLAGDLNAKHPFCNSAFFQPFTGEI